VSSIGGERRSRDQGTRNERKPRAVDFHS
jgi:hypothetical protein